MDTGLEQIKYSCRGCNTTFNHEVPTTTLAELTCLPANPTWQLRLCDSCLQTLEDASQEEQP